MVANTVPPPRPPLSDPICVTAPWTYCCTGCDKAWAFSRSLDPVWQADVELSHFLATGCSGRVAEAPTPG